MSKLTPELILCVKSKNTKHQRKVRLLGIKFHVSECFTVNWQNPYCHNPESENFDSVEGLLYTSQWTPEQLITLDPGVRRAKYFHRHSVVGAWSLIRSRIAARAAACRISNDLRTYPGNVPSHLRTKYVRGEPVRHKSMEEVVTEHFDHYNAVCIFPGSWLDIKLQEVYNSKRDQKNEEVNNDE